MILTQFELLDHIEHAIEIASYGPRPEPPVCVNVECITCGTVLIDGETLDMLIEEWER